MSLTQVILRKFVTSRPIILSNQSKCKILICQKSTGDIPPSSSSSSSSSSSESDQETTNKISSEDAVARLNTLLQQMVSDDISKAKTSIKLAQPTNKKAMGREEKELVTTESVEKQVINAVKNVADSLGGNTKQTESELLMKLLNPEETNDGSNKNLSDILKGMKIEREVKPQQSRAEQVRSVLQRFSSKTRAPGRPANQKRSKPLSVPVDQTQLQDVELFSSEPLDIFANASELKESSQLPTWQRLYEKELKLAVTHPPANYFQQMILWTEQSKFWQFPINNEFGLEEESKVYFADHVFLEKHLEPWCPPKGPIRHFMELVCVGLSKNSFLTVEAKKEHIEWFRRYFEEKRELLEEVGALPESQPKPKSIDKE